MHSTRLERYFNAQAGKLWTERQSHKCDQSQTRRSSYDKLRRLGPTTEPHNPESGKAKHGIAYEGAGVEFAARRFRVGLHLN
jgi:hypothetical protein